MVKIFNFMMDDGKKITKVKSKTFRDARKKRLKKLKEGNAVSRVRIGF